MAVANVLGEYSSEHFNALLPLDDALDPYRRAGGDAFVQDVFRKFFVQAGMDKTFGLALMHRHFPIDLNQKLVEYNGTSTAWIEDGKFPVRPHLWSFDDGGLLRPTEFTYPKRADDGSTFGYKELGFLFKLLKKLEEYGLSKTLGIALYPGDDFAGTCEITQGEANINLHPDDVRPRTYRSKSAADVCSGLPICSTFRLYIISPRH